MRAWKLKEAVQITGRRSILYSLEEKGLKGVYAESHKSGTSLDSVI